MTFSKFEKYAAGKIKSHASEVDAEAIWNDVLPHVQKGNNRKRGLIWFFFIGIITSLSALYVFSDNKNSDAENEIATLSSVNSTNEISVLKSSDPKGKKIDLAIIPEKPNEKNTQIFNKKTNEKAALKSEFVSKKTQKENSFTQIVQKQIETPETIESTPIVYKTEPETIPETEKNNPVIVPAKEETKNEVDQNIENKNATLTETEDSKIVAEDFSIIESQDSKTNQTDEEPGVDENEGEEDGSSSNSNKFKLKYGFGIYGGFSSSFASLKDKNGMNSNYLQLRLQTEEQLETIQLGMDFTAKSKFGVYFKTGIQYSRIARKFTLGSTIVTIDSVDGIQKIYINNMTGDTIFIYGQVPVTTSTTYNKITYNYFHLLDIPLLLGYTYKNESNNFSVGFEAGALINISTRTKGEIMTPDNGFYDMKADNLNWFKDNIGVSFTASVNVAYHLNENIQIYLAPTVRLESIFSTEANPIEQKHGSLGVNIGARYFIGD